MSDQYLVVDDVCSIAHKPIEDKTQAVHRLTSDTSLSQDACRLMQPIKINYQTTQLKSQPLHKAVSHQPQTKKSPYADIIFASSTMSAVLRDCERLAVNHKAIMVSGEAGVGKALVAKTCHEIYCQRQSKIAPISVVDASALGDEQFVETVFTSANKTSLMSQTENGTLLIKAADSLGPLSQIKLLEFIQTLEYSSFENSTVHYSIPQAGKVRVILSTSENIEAQVSLGKFRRDLYYNLCRRNIQIPALRSRKEDIPVLLDYFLSTAAKKMQKPIPSYPPELLLLLSNHYFSDNVRELKQLVEEAVSSHRSRLLSMKVFEQALTDATTSKEKAILLNPDESLPSLAEMNDYLIKEAMKRADNNQSLAAKMLGISQPALSRRLKNYKKAL